MALALQIQSQFTYIIVEQYRLIHITTAGVFEVFLHHIWHIRKNSVQLSQGDCDAIAKWLLYEQSISRGPSDALRGTPVEKDGLRRGADPGERNGTVRRCRFGASVSAMKCEMCFPLKCHQSAKVRTAVMKRAGARFCVALVPDLSNYAVFIVIHDVYHGFRSAITSYSYTGGQVMARKYDIFLA